MNIIPACRADVAGNLLAIVLLQLSLASSVVCKLKASIILENFRLYTHLLLRIDNMVLAFFYCSSIFLKYGQNARFMNLDSRFLC